MKTQPLLAASLLAVTTLLPLPARAAVVQFNGSSAGSPLTLTTSGSYGSPTLAPAATASFLISINDAVPTLTYSQIALTFPGFTQTNSAAFTTGLGQTTTVTQDLTFDPFTIIYTGAEALALTATTGGNYNIALPTIMAFSSLALSGHYVLTGPTQTHNGTFGTASFAPAGSVSSFRWGIFNSTGYPATSILVGPNASPLNRTRWGAFGNVIDDTVDGVHITTDLGTATINDIPLGNINLTAAPEPASCGLLGLGALLLAARRRR